MESRESIQVGFDVYETAAIAAECVVNALSGSHAVKTVALAGGTTPSILYAALALPYNRDRIDWDQIEWFFSDERCVPPNHPDSNYRLANEHLLKPLGISAERIHRMPADANDFSQAASDYEHDIRQLVPVNDSGVPAFDLILLGVGTDGHTASLFPGSAALTERSRLVVANEIPSLGAWRMTMTYPLLRAARQIVVFIAGAHKAQVLEHIFSPDADPVELPAVGLRNAVGQVTWILDAEAARLVLDRKPE